MSAPLSGLTPAEIAETLGLKPFQGKQVFRWIHQKRVFDFAAMTDLSRETRDALADKCAATQLEPADMVDSPKTNTKKVLLAMADGETVESVLIRDRDRVTLCLSTQAGCSIQCPFCASGQAGLRRNLEAGEIVEQALYLLSGEDLGGRSPTVVYMGTGEPFFNYDAVVRSIRLLMAKDGMGVGARRITVSTVGEVPGIYRFAREDWQVRLAISLHAANDTVRSELVPLNRKYPLVKLMKAVRDYAAHTGRQVSFEWTLLEGVNDSAKDAAEFAGLIHGLKATVNLIRYNPVAESKYEPPSPKACKAFRDALEAHGANATLRKERGQDIDAACGQLRIRKARR